MKELIRSHWFVLLLFFIIIVVMVHEFAQNSNDSPRIISSQSPDSTWEAPSLYSDVTTTGKERQMVIYGEDLIAHTARYLGPRGSLRQMSNGMNCQNCHLDAGTRPWGNNFGAVYANYPKFRARSGTVENIYKRVNDCFERSLNGKILDTSSYEMQSIYAYLKWLGKDVPRGSKPFSSVPPAVPYLDRAADPQKGRLVYAKVCQTCHGSQGEGQLNPDGKGYQYPPLWGDHSYNDGAGLYRLGRFASFVKNNMPFNQATHAEPLLTDEEAWDVAAFVNSQPRPHIDQSRDWPDISKKSVDEPFGPYKDRFSEQQHKFGPYKPMESSVQMK